MRRSRLRSQACPLVSPLSRRHFVQGLASGALLLAAGSRPARAVTGQLPAIDPRAASGRHDPGAASDRDDPSGVLCGNDFHLEIGTRRVNFTGAVRTATVVNGRLPAPLLRWKEGDTVTVRVSNRLTSPTSIHWHGILLPANMDGVPGVSFPGIPPGTTFAYRFQVRQSGTYWYHSHSRFQEQVGLYGPLIIEPRGAERHHADREHVILLSDWTDADPEHLYRTLKVQSDYFNYGKRTVGDFFADIRRQGLQSTLEDRRMWGEMRMNPTDLLDVSSHAYTYLLNGATPASNWTGLFGRGERVRLRIINGSSMTFFDIRIPGLKLTMVAADGQDIEPVTVDEFRMGPAEVYDAIVEPKDDRAYTIFAQTLDRSGYARGTLAPALGMVAEIPPLDPRPLLSMMDMGMAHGQGMAPAEDMGRMDTGMAHGEGAGHTDMGMAHGEGAGHTDMGMAHGEGAGHTDMGMAHGEGAGHTDMDMAQGEPAPQMSMGRDSGRFGPNVDSVAAQPTSRLDDPGVGLRDNGRRALTYSDLHTLAGPVDPREPGREIRLHLTGHMQRFVWSFDGQKFSESKPLRFNHGERLRIVLVNDSMMSHPIHLHGMWSEVEGADGEFLVRKHTVTVQPGQRLSYAVNADALGRWAYHCHLLYHMEAGMFREVVVAPSAGDAQS